MHNFQANYDKIFEILNKIEKLNSFIVQIRKPKLSDKELIAINLTAEYMGIDSECQLFRILPSNLKNRIERSVYNRRKRRLFEAHNKIRLKLSNYFNEFEDYFIVDSMPLEICKMSRANRSKICREDVISSPSRGYCASQSMPYFGYKLHAVCSVNGVIKDFDLTNASVHDIHYLKDVKNQMKDCVLLADKGYLSAEYQLDLFTQSNIKIEVPMRKNQHNFKQQPYIFRKSRKRIETIFSGAL